MTTRTRTTTAATRDAAAEPSNRQSVLKFKKRMLAWNNPVEFVNNMYGCHPDEGGNEYFKKVFGQ